MTLTVSPPALEDHVQPFQIEAPGLRGRLVRLGPAVARMLEGHDYPPPVARMLAEATAMAVVLASGLKFDGLFTLQLHGNGPVRLLVVDIDSDGNLRGYARFDGNRIPQARSLADSPVPHLLGVGHMAFTVDQGPSTERYQGITSLEGTTLSDCALAYFRQSEQLETAIRVCATDMMIGNTPHASALMLQRLPVSGPFEDEADDDWRRAVILMSSATMEELLAPALSSAAILYRLFHQDGVRIYRPRALRHQCRCSRERVLRTLRTFPVEEREEMGEDGVITVTCEFCKAVYVLPTSLESSDT